MPLLNGEHNVGRNIREMMAAGHSREQAVAASVKHAKKHRKAKRKYKDKQDYRDSIVDKSWIPD